jgi:hypothetical protein
MPFVRGRLAQAMLHNQNCQYSFTRQEEEARRKSIAAARFKSCLNRKDPSRISVAAAARDHSHYQSTERKEANGERLGRIEIFPQLGMGTARLRMNCREIAPGRGKGVDISGRVT